MRGTIHLIIFAATVDIHTGDGSIITQIPSGMSWDTKGLPTCSKTDYKSSRRELITPSYSIVSEDRKARRTTGWSLLLPVAAVMFYMQNTAYTGTIR